VTSAAEDAAELPIYTQIMLNLSEFMQQNAIIILVVFFGGSIFAAPLHQDAQGEAGTSIGCRWSTPIINNIVIKNRHRPVRLRLPHVVRRGGAGRPAGDGRHCNKVIEGELKKRAKAEGRQVISFKPLSASLISRRSSARCWRSARRPPD